MMEIEMRWFWESLYPIIEPEILTTNTEQEPYGKRNK